MPFIDTYNFSRTLCRMLSAWTVLTHFSGNHLFYFNSDLCTNQAAERSFLIDFSNFSRAYGVCWWASATVAATAGAACKV